VGRAGTGKTHYLIALARAAVEAGHRVRYYTAIELVEPLWRALADNAVGRTIGQICRHHLIVIDEVGFAPPGPHRLPAPVPARLRRLRETIPGRGVTLTVRGMGTLPSRPTHRRLTPRPALPPRPHHHHHRTELPANPPHHRRRQHIEDARNSVGHQQGPPLA